MCVRGGGKGADDVEGKAERQREYLSLHKICAPLKCRQWEEFQLFNQKENGSAFKCCNWSQRNLMWADIEYEGNGKKINVAPT